jgi:hypothetical protein
MAGLNIRVRLAAGRQRTVLSAHADGSAFPESDIFQIRYLRIIVKKNV